MTTAVVIMLLSALLPQQQLEITVNDLLRSISQATDVAVEGWQFRVETGTQKGQEHQRPWQPVTLPHQTTEMRFLYRSEIRIPTIFAGTRINGGKAFCELGLRGPVDFKAEVYVDGELKAEWPILDPETRESSMPQILLTENAKPGDRFQVEISVVNLSKYPVHEFLDSTRDCSLRNARLILEAAEEMREELYRFSVNIDAGSRMLPSSTSVSDRRPFWPAYENFSKLDLDETKRLRKVLNSAIQHFDMVALRNGETEKLRISMAKVLAEAAPVGEFAKQFTIYLVGNAHIDLGWLWRTVESVEISASTFKSVFNNMAEFPDLIYAQSQAQAYEWVEQKYPQLFAEIQESVKSGSWDVVGGMWAEADCNLISGESWVRQLLYGQRYFQEKFGRHAELGWNPDSFGYNWNMPQLFSKAGIKAFVTQKISWNDTTTFPYHLFWWEAPDGTRILTYLPTGGYTESVDPTRMINQLLRFEFCTGFKEMLVLCGLGNHGGGPNRDMLQRAMMLQQQPLYPKVKFIRAHDFIELLLQKDLSHLPVWRSELYLEQHRGTYTTQSETKRNNRKCEALLETAEKAAAIAMLFGADYPREALEKAWKIVLLNQFHDILPGSSITPVYYDADETYALARKLAKRALGESLDAIAAKVNVPENGWRSVLVFNPLSWNRNDCVRIYLPPDAPENITVSDAGGNVVPSQIVLSEDGLDRELLFIARDVPSLGFELFTLHEGEAMVSASDLETESYAIENRYLRVEVNPESGNISSIYDKANDVQALAQGAEGNRLQLLENIPSYWDAWNIGYTGRSWALDKADSVELIERGPVRAILRIKKSFFGLGKANRDPTAGFPSSFFVQDITLYAGRPAVDVTLHTDWWEDHTMLKVAFPFNVESDTVTYEIPFGAIERPTVREEEWQKARFEVPVHRWADLSADGYGVSLLNDSKYGMDTLGNVMRLSIHTSPVWPDPIADRGKHSCSYSIYPHKGDWRSAYTVRLAQELNLPLMARFFENKHGDYLRPEKSFVSIEAENVDLTCFKPAEDGDGYIVRLVETAGLGGEVSVTLPGNITSAAEVDLLEREIGTANFSGNKLRLQINPYEIKSFKVIIQSAQVGN